MSARAARRPKASVQAEPAPTLFSVVVPVEAPLHVSVPTVARVLEITLEFGMYGANSKPLTGARWRASFYDSARGQFYAGSADCPWEAIGWALFEREQRIANDEHPTVTRSGTETPLQALARLREVSRCR